MMNLKVKRICKTAVLPQRATVESAGFDLSACLSEAVTIKPHAVVKIPIGVAIQLEKGTVGLIYPRSGLASKHGITLANCVGVIDSDYRGELIVPLINHSEKAFVVANGDRVAQLIVTPILLPEIEEVYELDQSIRGDNGFGSTGKERLI